MQIHGRSLDHRRRLSGMYPGDTADFNPNACTFTPAMDKRAAPGPFAAAPIVQGNWDGSGVPDILSFSRGAQIASNWYANFDPYQGGGFCIWTPEQSTGDQASYAEIFSATAGAYYLDYSYVQGRYRLRIGGQSVYVSATITAGTPEYLAWGFDTNNKLDGTNYAYLSRNDTQTFGITTQPTVAAPDATILIGSAYGTFPSNGIIEGLVLVREIPWTGAYGTDLGQGDIVAAHAAGADVALSIGSWGTTFSLPTDSTVGALVTGTGEAWSHPHASNVLGVGGFMTDGTYTNDGWADEGTPTAVAALATAERIFLGGYKVTSDAANEGIYQDITVSAGDDVVIRAIGHSDGTSVPVCILYDQDNTAEIGRITGTTGSTRAAPDVFLFTGEAPAGCTTIRVKLINSDATAAHITYWHQCEVLDNLIDNPSLESGAGDPWIPTGWSNVSLGAGDTEAEAVTLHSGAASLECNPAAASDGMYQAIARTVGDFYAMGGWIYGDGGVGIRVQGWSTSWALLQYSASTNSLAYSTAASWNHIAGVWRALSTTVRCVVWISPSASGDRFADDIYFIPLTAVSLTVTPASEANSAETTGLRVDGRDACTQPLAHLEPKRGRIRWRWTPRHDAADAVKFGTLSALAELLLLFFDNSNYIGVYFSAANIISLGIYVRAVWQSDQHACPGEFVAGTTYHMEVRWNSVEATLLVNGIVTNTVTPAAGINFPTTAGTIYWGSDNGPNKQADATFERP